MKKAFPSIANSIFHLTFVQSADEIYRKHLKLVVKDAIFEL